MALEARKALISGASQGIGEAIAKQFAAAGAAVVVSARNESELARVAGEIASCGGTSHVVPADIAEADDVASLIETAVEYLGRIDILVHNAGIFPYDPIETMEEEAWSRVLAVNLTSAYRLTRGCLPHMKGRPGGRLLYTSSIQGNRVAVPGCAHYAASKGGLNGFIRSVALEMAPYGITVNGVEPGLVLTPGVAAALSEGQRRRMAEFVPLKRWGDPDDIAKTMLFLASPDADYITGQTVVVDGGALLPASGAMMATEA